VNVIDTVLYHPYHEPDLTVSGDGRLHTTQMVANREHNGDYDIHYRMSTDYGISWPHFDLVNDQEDEHQSDPALAVDRQGYAYVAWYDFRNLYKSQIWFGTNRPLGVGEQGPEPPVAHKPAAPTIVRAVLHMPQPATRHSSFALLNCVGRKVMDLHPGALPSEGHPDPLTARCDCRFQIPD
jgi:hypothetical protein